MPSEKNLKDTLLDNIVASTVLAKYLGLNHNFFPSNKNSKVLKENFSVFTVEGVLHIKVKKETLKYLKEYHAVVIDSNEDISEYDYIVNLNKNKKIGFWR